jgi:hypothetical protein
MAPPTNIYIYVFSCGHVLLFALSIFHRDYLDFRITTLFIPYDLGDYVMHACIYITFLSRFEAR